MPRSSGGTRNLSTATIRKILERQRVAASQERLQAQADKAKRSFRARKADYGKLVFVGINGKRNPQSKGRKGYLVYVTKGGKKQLVKSQGQKGIIRAVRISNADVPIRRNITKNAPKEFQASRRVMVSKHRAVVKGEGSIGIKGVNDFSETVVKKIARSIKKAIEGQASKRSFLISANVLVSLPDGQTRVYQVQVPIARPDHIAIKLGGIVNFVKKKFYAFMAKEMAYDGYVSSGSANHISRQNQNYGVSKGNWETKDGEAWRGQDSEIVHIESIEWKIEQIK